MFKNTFTYTMLLLFAMTALFPSCEVTELESIDSIEFEKEYEIEIFSDGRIGEVGATELDPSAPPPPPGDPRGPVRSLRRCYNLVFPVTIALADSTTITASSFEELATAIREWLAANPDPEQTPTVVFPLDVELDNGTTLTINNLRELGAVLVRCVSRSIQRHHRRHYVDCYDVLFPVTIGFPDGTTEVVDSSSALRQILADWTESNPDATQRPALVFPFDVMLEDGSVITITSEEERRRLRLECHRRNRRMPHRGEGDITDNNCYTLVYPVVINFPDESTAEYGDRESLMAGIIEWRDGNPDSEDHPQLALPYSVELMDGTIVSIEDRADINRLRSHCRGSRRNVGNRCFRVVFPLTVELPDQSMAEVNSKRELYELYREWMMNNPDAEGRPSIAFPYSIEFTDGTVVVVESRRDLLEAAWSCRRSRRPGRGRPFFNRNICYELVFPITIAYPDETSEEVASREDARAALEAWWEANPNEEEDPMIAFPYDIKLRNGDVVSIENEEDQEEYRRRCRRW